MNTDVLRSFVLATLSTLLGCATASRHPANAPCANIQISSSISPPLNNAELRWICGDPENAAYRDVPLYQAAFHLRAFLDNRGYVNAQIKIAGGTLEVEPGKQVQVESVSILPEDASLSRLANRFKGSVLRPSLLNSLESTVKRKLLETGYSCAAVSSQANGAHVSLKIVRGPLRNFENFIVAPIPGLLPEALLRFRPFEPKTLYDVRLLELYKKRLLRDNVVQGSYFKENCKEGNAPVEQSFLLGPPRTLRFGVGVDTESGPLLQASWRHHRFSKMAAQASFTLQASLVEQSFIARSEYFPWPHRPRTSLAPQLRISRSQTEDLTEVTQALEAVSTRTWDMTQAKWSLGVGPAFITNWYQTAANSRFRQESSMALIARSEMRTHAYEIFDAHPQDGSLVAISGEFRDPSLGFPDRTFRVAAEARTLRGLGGCGRGRCVGALRVSASNTWTTSSSLASLPPSLKTYLGGFESLRGFGPQSIPDNEGLGALSSAASGIELRGVDLILPKWEPYAFFDFGAVGVNSKQLDAAVYSSLGIGLRWSSPIGLVQGYLSRPSLGDFYAYAAFGGEF
jgi:outer membrane translocation and assembly module TamA